jgi:hypothetical protein
MQDKDKHLIEQLIDQVNDFIEDLANSASDALGQAQATDSQSAAPGLLRGALWRRRRSLS